MRGSAVPIGVRHLRQLAEAFEQLLQAESHLQRLQAADRPKGPQGPIRDPEDQVEPLPSDTPGGRVGLCRGQRPPFRGRCAGGWGDVTHYLAG